MAQTFAGLADRIAQMRATAMERLPEVLDTIGAEIERDAKDEIGTYQRENMGELRSWDDLTKATQADRVRAGFSANEPLLRTGTLRDSITHTVEGNRAVIGSDDPIALYQELGTHGPGVGPSGYHVPPRPFLATAAYRNRARIVEAVLELFEKA